MPLGWDTNCLQPYTIHFLKHDILCILRLCPRLCPPKCLYAHAYARGQLPIHTYAYDSTHQFWSPAGIPTPIPIAHPYSRTYAYTFTPLCNWLGDTSLQRSLRRLSYPVLLDSYQQINQTNVGILGS
eukprot:COSAG02_NODE_14358_length_1280_cov_10.243014_2_plen_127_part_00